MSQHSKEIFFGLGDLKGTVDAKIRWPSGLIQEVKDIQPNCRVWLTEGSTPSKVEPFKPLNGGALSGEPRESKDNEIPNSIETWLLVPVPVPDGSRGPAHLVTFSSSSPAASEDAAAIYNLLFRSIFDRHRDLPLPTSFLIDEKGRIVKVYQGAVAPEQVKQDIGNIPKTSADRLRKALPFAGIANTFDYGRNQLSLGSVFFQHGYPDAAEEFFQAALKEAPASAEALYGLGSVYLKREKNAQARGLFQRAINASASYPETTPNAWNNLGILATRESDTKQAIGYFEKALQINPDHFIALENLGNAYRQQKQWDEARGTLERALKLKPEDPEANYSFGMVLAQSNDTQGAYEHLRKALKVRPIYPEALNNLGILYLRTHRRDEAVIQFETCIRVAPAFDQAYLNLARVYAIEGHAEKARAVLEALLAEHPNHPVARQALEELH